MRAIVQRRYGSPDVLQISDVDPPRIAPHQVLVRVRAASVHADVWHMTTGLPLLLRIMGGGFSKPKNPVPGTDMAGTVQAVGANVTRFVIGDDVFGETIHAEQWQNGGAYAELVAVDAERLARKPAHVSFEQAACVPTSGFIAVANLRRCKLHAGQHLLINGAAGGVGSIALQVAKAQGVEVTAVDGAQQLALLRTLGADHVVDYAAEDFTRREKTYDAVFDVVGSRALTDVRRALKDDGRYVLIGHDQYGAAHRDVLGSIPKFLKLMVLSRFVSHDLGIDFGKPPTPPIELLAKLLDEGKLTPVIDRAYPLEEAASAMRHLADGTAQGRIVLTISPAASAPRR